MSGLIRVDEAGRRRGVEQHGATARRGARGRAASRRAAAEKELTQFRSRHQAVTVAYPRGWASRQRQAVSTMTSSSS